MEKNKPLEEALRRLKELDSRINEDDSDDEILSELNEIVNGITKEIKLDVVKNNINPTLKYINLSDNPDPAFAEEGDSGFDLRAYLPHDIEIEPGDMAVVQTGLYFEVEKGLEIQVRPRSGIARKHVVIIVNSPGTVDSHYRGEVQIILANLGKRTFRIKNGDRVAQGVVCPVYGEGKLNLQKVQILSETKRSDKGFGSTGIQ